MNEPILPSRVAAAVFTGANEPLALREFPLPRLGPGELLVQVACCTLCGSDVHTYLGHRQTPTPTILGHEIVGRVVAWHGPHAPRDSRGRQLQRDDRVSWSVAASCGSCFYCRRGLPQKCERLFKYGHEACCGARALSGGLAEYCQLAPGTPLFYVPDAIPDVVAASANCATATVAAALRAAGDCRGEAVLVQGAGLLGLTLAAMLRTAGAGRVIVTDVDAERLRRAIDFGADEAFHPVEQSRELNEAIAAATHDRGMDAAFEMSGTNAAFDQGLRSLRIGGRYILVGAVSPGRPVAMEPETIVRRMLSIQGVHNYAPDDLGAALDFLAAHHARFPFADLVERVFPLGEVEAAFQTMIESGAIRAAVAPHLRVGEPIAPAPHWRRAANGSKNGSTNGDGDANPAAKTPPTVGQTS